jgi:hypothetical protein
MAYRSVSDGEMVHAVSLDDPSRTCCHLPVEELEQRREAFPPAGDDGCEICRSSVNRR